MKKQNAFSIVALLLAIPLLASCLGPHDPDPTGSAPVGHLDGITGYGTSIRATGWFIDPDTHQPIRTYIAVEGVVNDVLANLPHPDVTKRFPKHGSRHGFNVVSQQLAPGTYVACVWAKNVGRGLHDRNLGCHDVVVDGQVDPIGGFESAQLVGSEQVKLTGWALDLDTFSPVDVQITVDGVSQYRGATNLRRTDINSRYLRTGNHGFDVTLNIASGERNAREICVTAINKGRGQSRTVGCQTIGVTRYSPVAPGDSITHTQIVGPARGHALRNVQRDAGINVTLSDNSTLWLFGDSLELRPDGSARYFVNNTAAWAYPPTGSNPHMSMITRDAATQNGEPIQFVTPQTASFSCPAGYSQAMWPTSAVAIPNAATGGDRVVAFFGNVCLGRIGQMLGRGMAVVEWQYNPAQNYDGQPIRGQVINPLLFPVGLSYGTAATFVDDESGGYIYAYRCERPADDPNNDGIIWPDAFGDCFVIRVRPAHVATLTAWEALVGFEGGVDSDEPQWASITGLNHNQQLVIADDLSPQTIEMPDLEGTNSVYRRPVAGFTVINNPNGPGYLMVYSPWPGYTSHVALRHANNPWGPWSQPQVRILPGCDDYLGTAHRVCYATTVHGQPGPNNQLRLGWYDQLIHAPPSKGAFIAGLTSPVQLIDE